MSVRVRSFALRVTILSILAGPVMAQEGQESPQAGAALEEIVVTAQKREQSSQDVAISIQAIGADTLEKLGATQVTDLAQSAPSLSLGGLSGSQQSMGLRGVVDFSRNIGIDARMGTYIDGVYQGRSSTANQPLLGVQSVEILRGPQGTLFGMNTVSGAININTRKASDEFSGQLVGGVGNEGYWTGSAYLNGPLSENVFGYIAYTHQERDGWYRDPYTSGVGDWKQDGARGQLRWLPTDEFEVILAADYGKTDGTGPLYTRFDDPAYYTEKGPERDDVKFWGSALTLNYTTAGDYTLTSISAYRDNQYVSEADEDFSALVEAFQTEFDEDGNQFSQEFRLVSPIGESFDWVAGLYYFDSEVSTGRNIYFSAPILPSTALAGFVAIPSTVDSRSYAAYVNGNYRFTDNLELTAGLRYTDVEKKLDFEQVNSPDDAAAATALLIALGRPPAQAAFIGSQVPGALFGALNLTYKDKYSDDAVTPTIGLNYRLNPDVLIYGRYSNGFQSGGFNADFNPYLPLIQFDSETVDAYEIGLKSTLADGRLRLNAAAFTQKYKDFQLFQRLLIGSTSVQVVTNAGEATSEGLETEVTWLPTDRLQLTFNGTWLDATYDKFDNPAYVLDPTGQEPANFNGNDLNFAPEWKAFVGVQYTQPVGSAGDVVFNVDYSYQDKMYSDPHNRPTDTIPSYDLWNARVAYMTSSDRWSVAAWIRNIGDEEYIINRNTASITNIDRVVWGTPRLYGVNFTYNLGE